MRTYRVESTISTSNAKIQIQVREEVQDLEMSIALQATITKTKQSLACLGQMFSDDVTIMLQGRGTLTVFEGYQVFGDLFKEFLKTHEDPEVNIIAEADSDADEYANRTVVLQNVNFDIADLLRIDDMNTENKVVLPFTFSGIDVISDFNRKEVEDV